MVQVVKEVDATGLRSVLAGSAQHAGIVAQRPGSAPGYLPGTLDRRNLRKEIRFVFSQR